MDKIKWLIEKLESMKTFVEKVKDMSEEEIDQLSKELAAKAGKGKRK